MQALEDKITQLGFEKDKQEDKKELAEAIAMSETAEASQAAAAAPLPRGGDAIDVDDDPANLD